MIRFVHPEAFLLGLLFLLVLRQRFVHGRFVSALRAILLLLVLGLLAQPYLAGRAAGRDLVIVVDRSRSVPEGVLDTVGEYAELAEKAAEKGDRIGVVLFGREAVIEQSPVEGYRYSTPQRDVDPDGTDLAGAIDAALAIIPPGRQGSILVVSDGESTGRDAGAAARHALRRGIRIDAVPVRRAGVFDLAVEEVALPGEVAVGEPFQLSVWVRADRAAEAPFTLLRDGRPIATGKRRFRRGLNRLRFRDRLVSQGVHRYEIRVDVEGDRVLENNRARGALRVTGPFRILCVTPEGRQDRLTRSLTAAGLSVDVTKPGLAPLTLDALDGIRAVVLEDVPLTDLPQGAADALQIYVRDLGGGLLMTGGRASYGPGGYYKSAIEEALPVSMEIREEDRKFALAMAIALDRSGSMGMTVPSGESKMDLANRGAIAAVEMLGRQDSVAVIAVDSAPHVVVPLTSAANKAAIVSRVREIDSMGGGIFTYTAVVAAARELRKAGQGTKHIVIFADANDAEEPGDYKTLVPQLRRAGVTLSVIGLGRGTDSDSDFLRDLARLGGGRCFFGEDATDLPRMFAQETIQVARSSIVEEPASVSVLPDIITVGALQGGTFPAVGGYSIAYAKPGAQRGLVAKDETAAPLLTFWQYGLGRSAAYLGIADGALSGRVGSWEGYAEFFGTLVRWIAGTEAAGAVYAEVNRRGHEAVLSVEVEAGRQDLLGSIEARLLDPKGESRRVLLSRVDDTRLEARMPLPDEGVYRPVLRLADGRFLRLPAMTLPYSPEFEPRMDPAEGEKVLKRLVRTAEGRIDPVADQIMAGSRESLGVTPLSGLFAWAALAFLLAEVVVRRLRPTLPQRVSEVPRRLWAGVTSRVARLRTKRRRKKARSAAFLEPEEGEAVAPASRQAPKEETPSDDGITSVLDRAKKRRGR